MKKFTWFSDSAATQSLVEVDNTLHLEKAIQFQLWEIERMKYFCILHVCRGSLPVEIDFKPYELSESTLLVLYNGQFVQGLSKSDDLAISYIAMSSEVWVEVTAGLDSSFFSFLKKYPCSPPLNEGHLFLLNSQMFAIRSIYQDRKHTFRLQIFKNLVQNFLMDMYNRTKQNFLSRNIHNTNRQEELFEKFIALVVQHSSLHRDVNFYANELCVTPRYLSSVVQNMTGTPPKNIIDERCIQEMKVLLRTTNRSVQEIAFQLNFPDQSFFARYFRKHVHMSPLEYREQKQCH